MTRISDVRPSFGQPQPIQSMMDVGANEDGGIKTLVSLADPEVLGNALLESGPTGALAQKAMRFAFGVFDPTQGGPPIEWTAERLRKETEGIDPELWDRLSDARTEFELAYLKADLQAKTQRQIALQRAQWGGVAASVGAQIFDGVSVGAMLATGGFSTAATGGRAALTAARLAQLGKLGLINAVPTAATEAIRASEDPRVTGTEIAGNIASDFVFGATAGALVDASRIRRFVGVGSAVGLTNAAFTANDSEAESGQLFAATALGFLIPGAFASIHGVRTPVDDALTVAGERMVQRSDVAVATAAGTPLTDKGLKVYSSVTGEAAIADFDDTLSKLTGVYEIAGIDAERAGVGYDFASARRARGEQPVIEQIDRPAAEIRKVPAGLTDAQAVKMILGEAETRGVTPTQTLKDGSVMFSGEEQARSFVSIANASVLGSTSRFFQAQQLMGSDSWVVTRRSASEVVNDNIASWKAGRTEIESEIESAYEQASLDAMRPLPLGDELPAIQRGQGSKFWETIAKMATENRVSTGGEFEPVVMKAVSDEAKNVILARRRGADAVGATPIILNAFSRRFTDSAATAVIRKSYPSLSITEANNMVQAVRASASVPMPDSPDFNAWSSQYRKQSGFNNIGDPDIVTVKAGNFESFRIGSTSPGSAQQPSGNPLFLEKNVDSPINLHNITDATISRIPLPEWMQVGALKRVDLGKFRFSNAAFVGRSEVPEFRLLGNLFNTDVVPKVDGYAQYGALSQVEDAQRGFLIRHEQTLAKEYDRHVKQQKAAGQKPLSFDEFNAAVVKTMRRGGGSSDVTLNAAAKELKAVYDGLLDYAVAHNVPGALKVKEATKKVTNRVPRSYNRAIIDKDLMDFAAKYGAEGRARLEEAWTEAVYRDLDLGKSQQADPARGKKLANLIAKRIIENAGTQRDLRGVIGGMSKDELARMVREVFSDATPEEVSGLAARILSDDDKGVTPLRQRAPLDETYVHRFDDGTSYAIEDRLDSDPRRLFMSDASNMIGASALIEASRVWTARTGREGFNTIDELVARLREIAAERGVDPLDTNIERIAWAAKKTLGYPTFEAKSVSSRRAMALMQANINAQYMRLLATPTMGMVNATDVIRATAEFGNAGILKNIPELVSMIERAKKGDIEGFQLLAYMTHDLGIGASAFSNGPIRNLADSNANIDRILSKAQNAASTGADFSARMSGQKITQDVGELMTAWAYIDITTKLAVANQEPSANQLRELGMDLAEWNRVAKQIRQHALKVEETGEAWHPNTDDWTDAEARANYDIAIKRNVRRAMNLVDVTSLPMLADHPGGKLMLQFRKFGLRSAETQLAYHADTLARGDAAVALSRLTMGSALGVLQYTLASGFAVATAAAFGGDPGKVADERFTAKNLALSGFGRAAWSSLLPMGVDIGLAATGNKAVFSPMRVSGIGADNGALAMAFGNPSFDWAANAIGMVESFRAPFDSEYNFSARNVRTIMNGAFVPNILGLRDGINYIAKDVLPERSTNE